MKKYRKRLHTKRTHCWLLKCRFYSPLVANWDKAKISTTSLSACRRIEGTHEKKNFNKNVGSKVWCGISTSQKALKGFSGDIISQHFKSVFISIVEVSTLGNVSFPFRLTRRYNKKSKTGKRLKRQCNGWSFGTHYRCIWQHNKIHYS